MTGSELSSPVLSSSSLDAAGDDSPTLDADEETRDLELETLPTLTLVAHPNVARLGESVHLHSLLVRRPAVLSRTQMGFSFVGGAQTPLLDVSVSRSGITFRAGYDGSIQLDPGGLKLQVDGAITTGAIELSASRIARGVKLRLSSRVGLLLHYRAQMHAHEHPQLLGDSTGMQSLRASIARAASSPAAVLILGESGTGKELVAAAVHNQSSRASKPWVAINMATLNENTAYSDLFGHRKGAFTGAEATRAGVFERAYGGSLFFDEVADATPRVQAMLLRALETSRVLPLGANSECSIDVRVLAATERDLASGMLTGTFRPSLGQRLAGIVINVPTLRERRDDIPRLLVHFLSTLDPARSERWLDPSSRHPGASLSTEFMFKLLSYDFPGNVRELRNIATRLLATGREVSCALADLPSPSQTVVDPSVHPPYETRDAPVARPNLRCAYDEDAVLKALQEHDWSPARAARRLGVPNSTIHYWIKQKGLVRRAADYSDTELRNALQRIGNNPSALSKALSISERGLRLRLKRSHATIAQGDKP